MDGCPTVWMADLPYGWLSYPMDGCPTLWMAVLPALGLSYPMAVLPIYVQGTRPYILFWFHCVAFLGIHYLYIDHVLVCIANKLGSMPKYG